MQFFCGSTSLVGDIAVNIIVEVDGGSRGNPGPAGYGCVVWSGDRATVLAQRSEFIGQATNNVAEYRGLIAGLEQAQQLGADDVTVLMDSKLVVEQMSGRWKVKHPDMAQLYRQAQVLAVSLGCVRYRWIPRERNRYADRLANEAMDRAQEDAADQHDDQDLSVGQSGSQSGDQPAAQSADTSAAAPLNWTGHTDAPTRFLLLRHGQTELSRHRRYSGRGNPALTESGRCQAEAAARYLAQRGGIAAVLSSPLQRSYDTAAIAAKALARDVIVDEGLIETDFGAWEGLTFDEAAQRDPDVHQRWRRDSSVSPPGGESFAAVAHRVEQVRDRIIADYGGSTVLVVSHVTPIKTLLKLALAASDALLYRLHLDLASLSIAEFYPDGGACVRLVNQTAYLG